MEGPSAAKAAQMFTSTEKCKRDKAAADEKKRQEELEKEKKEQQEL